MAQHHDTTHHDTTRHNTHHDTHHTHTGVQQQRVTLSVHCKMYKAAGQGGQWCCIGYQRQGRWLVHNMVCVWCGVCVCVVMYVAICTHAILTSLPHFLAHAIPSHTHTTPTPHTFNSRIHTHANPNPHAHADPQTHTHPPHTPQVPTVSHTSCVPSSENIHTHSLAPQSMTKR